MGVNKKDYKTKIQIPEKVINFKRIFLNKIFFSDFVINGFTHEKLKN